MTESLPSVEQIKNFTLLLSTQSRLMLYAGTGDLIVLNSSQNTITSEYVKTLTHDI